MTTIGVFDSGVGGLSVLRALLVEMPDAHYFYLADSAFAPYGERSQEDVSARAHRITQALCKEFSIDALVVACNTATALAIEGLRSQWPTLNFIGVEPALKPAAALSQTGHIGVLATRRTVESDRFAKLRDRVLAGASRPLHFSCQACDGLADAIERGDTANIHLLCERYLGKLLSNPSADLPMDTLVLGCTHYPFAADTLQAICGPQVTLVETGAPVAKRTRSVLQMGATGALHATTKGGITLMTTGDPQILAQAAQSWLGLSATVTHITV